MRKAIVLICLAVVAVFIMSSCVKKDEKKGILGEVSGVWRASSDSAMVSIVYADDSLKLYINDILIPSTLGDVDRSNNIVNLNVTDPTGKREIWTIRQLWDKEHKSFNLQITLNDGLQDECTFVRKITSDDLKKFSNINAKKVGGISDAAQSVPPNSISTQISNNVTWSPSFDCSKVSNGPERLICSSKELSEADVKLAQVFKTALRNTPDKRALKQEQSAWINGKRNACSNIDSMLKVYDDRIKELMK